jgi:hypothetical protein
MSNQIYLLACSGPGAQAYIEHSILIGYICGALAGCITARLCWSAMKQVRSRAVMVVALILLVIHPAWAMSARSGDCGQLKRELSYVFTGAYTILLGLPWLSRFRRNTRNR